MKSSLFILFLCGSLLLKAQTAIDLSGYNNKGSSKVNVNGQLLDVSWPAGQKTEGRIILDLARDKPLFKSIGLKQKGSWNEIAGNLDPAFILTVGKRDLVSQNGWNIFFDKVPQKPYQSYTVSFDKQKASVSSIGAHTVIRIAEIHAASFTGALEITLFNGSPLLNIAAVISTPIDSTAIIYDAGLTGKSKVWDRIVWSDTGNRLQSAPVDMYAGSKALKVKYRTVMGEGPQGSLAIFPAPHQYFYPLDEAFNLSFTWYGDHYRSMITDFGLGIRQDLEGDKRFVPWFNAPPGTQQRLSFFCLLGASKAAALLGDVKKFTHGDSYVQLDGYKTMSSHFHNEFIMKVVLAGKPVPAKPSFVDVFKAAGINIVHLAEFHYTAHPKGPDEQRLQELHALFDQCKRLSDKDFLLLPGEEPNEFFGGHWLELFPKPVYWIMSRKPDTPFVADDARYGKVYRIGDKHDMLRLLQVENGLAWTAHARTKGSTGYPDAYRNEQFYVSDHFFGAAWKAMPADLSYDKLGRRVLDLQDDMNNWGLKKHIIGEADLFSIEPENEMYAHLNVNYLRLNKLPDFNGGWQPVLDVMKEGKFFTTTGEVLIPVFTVNGKAAGETVRLDGSDDADISIHLNWTFPLNFAEIVSGDGTRVYRERIDLRSTQAFGSRPFTFHPNLKGRKWVRVEVWDVAANGAFTQSVWLSTMNNKNFTRPVERSVQVHPH